LKMLCNILVQWNQIVKLSLLEMERTLKNL